MGVNSKVACALFVAGLLAGTTSCASHVAKGEPPSAAEPSSAERIASLQRALDDSAKTIAKLQTEIGQLRTREEELTNSLKEAIRERTGQPPLPRSATMAPMPDSAEVAAMKKDLEQERKRRMDLEQQLARLKSETASPAFADTSAQAREIGELRNALANEREAHKKLLNEVTALREKSKQVSLNEAPKGGGGTSESHALRTRLIDLEKRHQEVMTSMARTVAADRKREDELMAELAKAQEQAAAAQAGKVQTVAATTTDGHPGAVEQENVRLRSLLEEEKHRNARLAAKVKLAGRVTDLIFKMQNQPAQEVAPAAPPPP